MDVFMKENNVICQIFCLLLSENEKLFERSDAKLYWRTVLHVLALVHHAYVGLFASGMDFSQHSDERLGDLKKYGPCFLTGWNFAFQSIFLCLALVYDFAEWSECTENAVLSKVRYWRDVVFNALALPFSLFVSSMFWGLFLIERELVFPKIFDTAIPWWFNHSVHTWILVVIGLELYLQPRSRPEEETLNLSLCWFFSVLYAFVYYGVYFSSGKFLYHVFAVMSWPQICLYQLGIWLSIHSFYFLQWPIVHLIHGSSKKATKEVLRIEKGDEGIKSRKGLLCH